MQIEALDAHVVIIFVSKPVSRTKRTITELLELRKMIGIQANDLSIYNIFQRFSHGCHGRAERGVMLLETCILLISLDHAVRLQPSYLYLQSGYTNSVNLGAVVNLT